VGLIITHIRRFHVSPRDGYEFYDMNAIQYPTHNNNDRVDPRALSLDHNHIKIYFKNNYLRVITGSLLFPLLNQNEFIIETEP
jgi:hypothetical protein